MMHELSDPTPALDLVVDEVIAADGLPVWNHRKTDRVARTTLAWRAA